MNILNCLLLADKKEANWRNNKNQFASHPTKQPY